MRHGFLLLLALTGCACLLTLPRRDSARALSLIDVGQGDAAYIQSGGAGLLVDTGVPGSSADLSAPGPVSALLVTHLERDHAGDAAKVIARGNLAAVFWNGRTDAPLHGDVARAAGAAGVPLVALVPGDVLRVGDVRLGVLSPGPGYRTSADHNDSSLVLRADFPEFSALLTGDAPAEVERLLPPGPADVDVLKLGHHGSKTATGDHLLDLATPALALVSVGAGNRYGHPAPEVLARLEGRGIPLLRTDEQGTITVFWRDGELRASTSSAR